MAAITAAVIAIGAAVASTGAVAAGIATVATIGTIAAVVGGVGLALGAVGMITGNKTLTKIGTYLGAAAAGGGLGALAAQGLGLGASTAASSATSASTGAATAAEGGKDSALSGSSLVNSEVGGGVVGGLQQGANTALPGGVTGTATQSVQSGVSSGASSGAAQSAAGAAVAGQAVTSSLPPPTANPVNDAYNLAVQKATTGPIVHTPQVQAPMTPNTSNMSYGPMYGFLGAQMLSAPVTNLLNAGAAEQQLQIQEDMQRKHLDQNQQQIDLAKQQQSWVQKNAAYAPVVSFKRPGGLLATAMGKA